MPIVAAYCSTLSLCFAILRVPPGTFKDDFGIAKIDSTVNSRGPWYCRFASDHDVALGAAELPRWLFKYLGAPKLVEITALFETGMRFALVGWVTNVQIFQSH